MLCAGTTAQMGVFNEWGAHAKFSNRSCILSGRKERASEERGKNYPVIWRKMASYKVNNLVIDSPAFEIFIFITNQLESGHFLAKNWHCSVESRTLTVCLVWNIAETIMLQKNWPRFAQEQQMVFLNVWGAHPKFSNHSCILSGRKERASEERGKNDPVIGREMASYKVNNLVIDSPAFEIFIFITYQLESGNFLAKNWHCSVESRTLTVCLVWNIAETIMLQ